MTTTTETYVSVCVVDFPGNLHYFNIYCYKDDLTLEQIKTALAPIIETGIWYSPQGYQILEVKSARKVYIEQTKEEVQ